MAKKTQEEIWIEEVCELIGKKPCLQFFFQNLFEQTQLLSPAPVDPIYLSRYEGQRDIGLSIKEILDQNDPTLFPELLLARAAYLRDHASEVSMALSSDE